jgi:hypothetical protein
MQSTKVNQSMVLATAGDNAPGLLQQVFMAGSAAVITVSFIHPIDVVKVSLFFQMMRKLGLVTSCNDRLYFWIFPHFTFLSMMGNS